MSDKPRSAESPLGQAWEQMRDESGRAYGRRIYLPHQKGHLLQIYNPDPAGPVGTAFAHDFSDWFRPDKNPTPVPAPAPTPMPVTVDLNVVVQMLASMATTLLTLTNGVNAMSGTVSGIDAAIAELKAGIAAESAVVDQAIVYIQGVPAMVDAAIAAATKAAPLSAEQIKAFDDMKAAMADEGAKVTAALPAAPDPANPEPPVVPPEEPAAGP